MRSRSLVPLALLTFASWLAGAAPAASKAAAAPDGPAVELMLARARRYVELRVSQEARLPQLAPDESDARVIQRRTQALAAAMRRARASARPGDLLVPALRPRLRAVVAEELSRGDGAREVVAQDDPKPQAGAPTVPLSVNASYPQAASWGTVPPALLARLPQLPDDLQYRFVGDTLLVVDTKSLLIVDLLPLARRK